MDKFFSNYALSCLTNFASNNGIGFDEEQHKSSSLELLNSYRSSYNSFNVERLTKLLSKEMQSTDGSGELSTEEIMRVAAARFVQSSGNLSDPLKLLISSLTEEETKSVGLASRLLAAAEMISNREHDRARDLLGECCELSSGTGNPIQRVVYYFSDALLERVDRETGIPSSKRKRTSRASAQEVIKALRADHPVQLVTQQKLPFQQMVQFISIQTILDNLGSANKIHMIDTSIKHGLQWVILMQALATQSTCPIDYLKISAVGTSEEAISTTGRRLAGFAKSLNITFYFKAVIVTDIINLKKDMFEVEEGEAVGVYSSMDMNTMIGVPSRLENLLKVLRKLKPCIMTVADVEAKHNSPSFINRFTEALFYYSATFDLLNGFMDRSDIGRMFIEWSFISQGIRSIVTTEGNERVVRHVGISVWRLFFARFRLGETKLSEWSQYQASELAKQFARGDSCTLEFNGKSLTLGWKGTPLVFVSAWKFS